MTTSTESLPVLAVGPRVDARVESAICRRCELAVVGPRFDLRVVADPPGPGALELVLCENCLESFRRWLARRNRHWQAPPSDALASGTEAEAAEGAEARSRSRFADELKRQETGLRFRQVVAAAVGVVTVVAAAVVAVWTLAH